MTTTKTTTPKSGNGRIEKLRKRLAETAAEVEKARKATYAAEKANREAGKELLAALAGDLGDDLSSIERQGLGLSARRSS